MTRVRQNLEYIQYLHSTGEDKKPLETVIRAFHEMQKLDPSHPDSWFSISGWHGEPFRGPGETDSGWWGGYCNHGNVLFPTWHRALLIRLEEAMRRMPGCEDAALPYWDEYAAVPQKPEDDDYKDWNVIPRILTTPKFVLDDEEIDNPLYSYTLQRDLSQAKLKSAENLYTKGKGYSTVRFPLSGLVGTQQARALTERYNAQYQYPETVEILNRNVGNWLDGHTSLRKKLINCLQAPNYTVFSNTTSQNQWLNDYNEPGKEPIYVVSLESPHNGMHLAVGGFYIEGQFDANPERYKDANGDMGCNETASFDPIFYMHHCFIDSMFWKWQELHHCTDEGQLSVIEGYPGTIVAQDAPVGYPRGSLLDMSTSLFPFKKENGQYYTSHDVTDIRKLGYSYGVGSIDAELDTLPRGRARGGARGPILTTPEIPIAKIKRIHNIDRTQFNGSFVIKTYAKGPGMEEPILVGTEPILSRWNVEGCANCQSHLKAESIVPVDQSLMEILVGEAGEEGKGEIEYFTLIETSMGDIVDSRPQPPGGGPKGGPRGGREIQEPGKEYRIPIIDDLY